MNVPRDLLLRLIAPDVDPGQNPETFVICIHCDAIWTDPPTPHWKTEELQVEHHEYDCPVLEVQALLGHERERNAEDVQQWRKILKTYFPEVTNE